MDENSAPRRGIGAVHLGDEYVLFEGVVEHHVILVRIRACIKIRIGRSLVGRFRGHRLVSAVEREYAAVVPSIGLRHRDREFDHDGVVGGVISSEADMDEGPGRVFVIQIVDRYGHLRIVDDFHVEGEARFRPCRHVLVAHLDFYRPKPGLAECILYRDGVDVRPRRHILLDGNGAACFVRDGICLVRIGMRHGAVRDRLPVARRRPLVFETVLQVVAHVVELRLYSLDLPLRHLAPERGAVVFNGKTVHGNRLGRVEDRLFVVDENVYHLGRRDAGHFVCGIPALRRAEKDAERIRGAAVVVARAVENGKRAGGRRGRLRHRAARRAALGDILVSDYAGVASEHGNVDIFVAEEKRIDPAVVPVAFGERYLELYRVSLGVRIVLVVRSLAPRCRGHFDRDREQRRLARLAAHGSGDPHLRGLYARSGIFHLRRLAALQADERAVFAARGESLGERLPRRTAVALYLHLVARVRVGHVGVSVAYAHGDFNLVARDEFKPFGRTRRVGDDRLCGRYVQAGRFERTYPGRGLDGRVDLRSELHLLADALGVLVAADCVDVDVSLVRGARRYGHLRRGRGRRESLDGFARGREAHVITPAASVPVFERRRHRDFDRTVVVWLRHVHGKPRLADKVIAVGDGSRAVGLHHDARRQGFDASYAARHVFVVEDMPVSVESEAGPCAQNKIRRAAVHLASYGEIGRRRAAGHRHRPHLDRCGLGGPSHIIRGYDGIRAAFDFNGIAVHRPDVKRSRLGKRSCGGKFRRRGIGDGRSLVDGAPHGRRPGRIGVYRIEIDRLHVEAAFAKRIICYTLAVRRSGRRPLARAGVEVVQEIAFISADVRDFPLARSRRIEKIGAAVFRLGSRPRFGGERDRHREIARLRDVFENEICKIAAAHRLDERGVRKPAGNVYAYLERKVHIIDDLVGGADILEPPIRICITRDPGIKPHVEIKLPARIHWRRGCRVLVCRRPVSQTRTDLENIALCRRKKRPADRCGQSRRRTEKRFLHIHYFASLFIDPRFCCSILSRTISCARRRAASMSL